MRIPSQDTEKTPSSSAAAATNFANNGRKAPSSNGGGAAHRPVQVWFVLPFRLLCQICLALPLAGLVACLLVAVVFQFGDIQETACKVSEPRSAQFCLFNFMIHNLPGGRCFGKTNFPYNYLSSSCDAMRHFL